MYTRLQFALFASLAVLGIAIADAPQPAAAQTKAAKKAFNKAAHAGILTELHHAKHLLDLGLHDYHGHRARADHEIHKAIHLLEHAHHHKGEHKSNFKAVAHVGPITPETQNASD